MGGKGVGKREGGWTPAQRLRAAKALWGWEPHRGQAQVWLDPHAVKVVACGRRWGKTESAAVDSVTCAVFIPGWHEMVVAPTRDQAMIYYREAKARIEAVPDLAGAFKFRETPHPEIVGHDSGILYRTAGENGKNIRGHGKDLKRIRVDEAAYVKESVVTEVIEPMRLDCGAELILQGTPFGMNHFYTRYMRGIEGSGTKRDSYASYQFPTQTNPHLNAETFADIRDSMSPEGLQWRCEYCAEFVDSAGAVFPWHLIESSLYDHTEVWPWNDDAPRFGSYAGGIDIAMYTDFSALVIGGIDRGKLWIVDLDKFNRTDWVEQKRRFYDAFHRYDAVAVIDSSGLGDPIYDELVAGEWIGEGEDGRAKKRPGIKAEPKFKFTMASKLDLVNKLQLRLSQGLVRIPGGFVTGDGRDLGRQLVDEMKYYSFKTTDAGNVRFEAQTGFHDDMVTALMLANKRAFGQYEASIPEDRYAPGTWGYLMQEIERQEQAARSSRIRPRGVGLSV